MSLVEASPQVGGLASPWSLDGVVWARHSHVILPSDSRLLGLLEELDLLDQVRWVETKTGCHADGKTYSVSNTVEFLRFPPLRMIDKLRLGLTILYGSRIRRGDRLENVLVGDWLRRWSGRRTLERFWLPLLRAKLGETWRDTSAAFIWTTIRRLYQARRSGMKREVFGYVRGGYARILGRMEQQLRDGGTEILLGRAVSQVTPTSRGPEVQLTDGTTIDADHVVVTAAAPIAARLLPALDDDERRTLDQIRYMGILCASLLLRRPVSGFYLTYVLDEAPFTGVIEMTALVDPQELKGHSLVYLPRYMAADDPFFLVDDQAVEELFLSSLEKMYPSFDRSDVLCFRVSRVRYVLPVPTRQYSQHVPPVTTTNPAVHVVSSAQITSGTLNVNETLGLAEWALAELGAGTSTLGVR